jgi:hypothetical protein
MQNAILPFKSRLIVEYEAENTTPLNEVDVRKPLVVKFLKIMK